MIVDGDLDVGLADGDGGFVVGVFAGSGAWIAGIAVAVVVVVGLVGILEVGAVVAGRTDTV